MPPQDGLLEAALNFSSAVLAAVSVASVDHGLSAAQGRLLGILRTREPRMSEVADLLGLDKSSVSGLVARAETKGLVQRMEDAGDRRSSRVALTEEGREAGTRLAVDLAHRLVPLGSRFSTAHRALLAESLNEAAAALRATDNCAVEEA